MFNLQELPLAVRLKELFVYLRLLVVRAKLAGVSVTIDSLGSGLKHRSASSFLIVSHSSSPSGVTHLGVIMKFSPAVLGVSASTGSFAILSEDSLSDVIFCTSCALVDSPAFIPEPLAAVSMSRSGDSDLEYPDGPEIV